MNARADASPERLRISIDTKASVNIGEWSRGGCSRGLSPVVAADHDMMIKQKLVPGGVLETATGRSFLFFTEGAKTSDFIVDGIELWWRNNRARFGGIKELVVNMDNGPECGGHRSQFLSRMVDFADREQMRIHLVYYPPYHSKYNAIERYWGALERSWNGYLLDSVQTVLMRARNFCWKSMRTMTAQLGDLYPKGITLCSKAKKSLETRLSRSEILPWWDIVINPIMV
ncbi:MAG: transposase [Desulfobacteraceae bacterium IS3]|nr:MAG: transposase [Desulfobacteraceae bacterium IS3]